jgi:phosphopantetheinyl transferase
MALFLQEKSGDTYWAVWKMEESLDELLLLLPDRRRDSCRKELSRFASAHRKLEWTATRVLFYTLLPADKEIVYSPEGKPALSDASYFISISHTQGYAAVMLSATMPVGVDVEIYQSRVWHVAERFIRPDEHPAPYQDDLTWSLLLHWSAKESVYKCMEKVDADLRKLRIEPFIPASAGCFTLQELVSAAQQSYSIGYRILLPNLVLTYTQQSIQ